MQLKEIPISKSELKLFFVVLVLNSEGLPIDYKSGVITPEYCSETSLNHGVLLIGYGQGIYLFLLEVSPLSITNLTFGSENSLNRRIWQEIQR